MKVEWDDNCVNPGEKSITNEEFRRKNWNPDEQVKGVWREDLWHLIGNLNIDEIGEKDNESNNSIGSESKESSDNEGSNSTELSSDSGDNTAKVTVKEMIKELEQHIFANELMYKVEKGYIQPNLVIVARL